MSALNESLNITLEFHSHEPDEDFTRVHLNHSTSSSEEERY